MKSTVTILLIALLAVAAIAAHYHAEVTRLTDEHPAALAAARLAGLEEAEGFHDQVAALDREAEAIAAREAAALRQIERLTAELTEARTIIADLQSRPAPVPVAPPAAPAAPAPIPAPVPGAGVGQPAPVVPSAPAVDPRETKARLEIALAAARKTLKTWTTQFEAEEAEWATKKTGIRQSATERQKRRDTQAAAIAAKQAEIDALLVRLSTL